MDAIARGTATAALTLQSVILQALVYHGNMTPAEALEVVDKAVTAAAEGAKDKSQMEVARRYVRLLRSVVRPFVQ